MEIKPYKPKNTVRLITASSLFDGHDASINIMRRVLQQSGAEVIHLGHNRSVAEIVCCAIQEDVQGIAITSYQGGHIEYFKFIYELLQEKGAGHIKVFGGGGGTILPSEIQELMDYGITRIYSPDDGRSMGIQGMINDLLTKVDFTTPFTINGNLESQIKNKNPLAIAQAITLIETENYNITSINTLHEFSNNQTPVKFLLNSQPVSKKVPVLGITGTGGAGKSSLTDELMRRFLDEFPDKYLAVLSVDPSKRKSGGALLGDRIRMNSSFHERVYMRSFATKKANIALNKNVSTTIDLLKSVGFDFIIVETAGIGQSDSEITEVSDFCLYVMTPEYGASSQLEKIDMIDYADIIVLNKFDKRGSYDALRDIKKQYQRSRNLFDEDFNSMPVIGTIASQFNDPGTNELYNVMVLQMIEKFNLNWSRRINLETIQKEKEYIIPPDRIRYLSEICEELNHYQKFIESESILAEKAWKIRGTIEEFEANHPDLNIENLENLFNDTWNKLDSDTKLIINNWHTKISNFKSEIFVYNVRNKEIQVPNYTTTLSGLKIPKVSVPKFKNWGDITKWCYTENFPGEFPYTAGVYPFKRTEEDPTRMFAGEGCPERTNRRFHYLNEGMTAKRLSTAFDSVTLYGEDPDFRPDIFGKIGNSGVSIATLDDVKKLYSGFDLSLDKTSVSMTINGPAPIVLGFYLNAAIDQNCEKYIRNHGMIEEVHSKIISFYRDRGTEVPTYSGSIPTGNDSLGLFLLGITGDKVLEQSIYEKIKLNTLANVRGTVQADILKEDQAQNTCIFSIEFAVKMMGDIQEYFVRNDIRNFYSVSISGYHIAEAGANPITQVAFTLANGFTYVEYYLSRGLDIDSFAPNLSFFFSNGIDPEYAVIGRVARRIWAKALRFKYKANSRSQMLKYHIQTSGRSLHAQEIDFNDIRTTLQALYAIYDNCNSLHTNAYNEAITTPTEESVRRAVAIQLIINKELGLAKTENSLQGSFIIEELTNLVEDAILSEFKRLCERGGVLGAMETMYQRNKIQEESLHYEYLKHTGDIPIIGVNTFLSTNGSATIIPDEVTRSTYEEKNLQIMNVNKFKLTHEKEAALSLDRLKETARSNGNIFQALMEATKHSSLGQITHTLYDVGGQYRRSM